MDPNYEDAPDMGFGIPEPIRAGLPRSEWLNRDVTLFNNHGTIVGAGLIWNSDVADCIDSSRLGVDHVGVLIFESILAEYVPSD